MHDCDHCLALERKEGFDAGNYTEKRKLVTEIASVAVLAALEAQQQQEAKKAQGKQPQNEKEQETMNSIASGVIIATMLLKLTRRQRKRQTSKQGSMAWAWIYYGTVENV